jgi:spermidine synthase
VALRRLDGVTRLVILGTLTTVALASTPLAAEDLIDQSVRAEMLKRKDGPVVHIESEYNDIYVNKRRNQLKLSFQLMGWDYTESVANLRDPDELVLRYSQVMTAAILYAGELKRILMLGLGGGSISTYLAGFLPEARVDTVEIDRRVIETAKTYFGLIETPRVRYLDGDGRVFLTRSKETYDLILIDAFQGGYVPFHLLTKEFYALVKERLAPNGAAVFNVHDGTRLYHSTVKTLGEVFPTVELYPSGVGEVATIVSPQAAPSPDALASRATELQELYKFRFALPQLLKRRMANPQKEAAGGDVITDDFAPVSLYNTMGKGRRRLK